MAGNPFGILFGAPPIWCIVVVTEFWNESSSTQVTHLADLKDYFLTQQGLWSDRLRPQCGIFFGRLLVFRNFPPVQPGISDHKF
jgi:hypothetical protein